MFDVIASSVMPSLLAAASRASNLTLRSTFGRLVNEQHGAETNDDISADEGEEETGINANYLFLIIPNVWAALSNFVVIITILRTATILRSFAYVMISLSLVDLCSSLFVIPFSIYFFANRMHWGLGYSLCVLWTAADVMFCTASICHHCAIALHRYLIISSPHDFSVTNNHKIIYRLIVPAWCVSAFIALVLVIRSAVDSDLIYDEHGTCGINDRSYAIYSSIVSFFIPLSIIVVVSLRSIFILQKRIAAKRRTHFSVRQQRLSSQQSVPSPTEENRGSFDYYEDSMKSSSIPPVLRTKRPLSNFFDRASFRYDRNSSKRKRRKGDDEVVVTTKRIIFSSKPRTHVSRSVSSRTKYSSSRSIVRHESSLYRALESLAGRTLAITPSEDSAGSHSLTINGLLQLGFGPKLRSTRLSSAASPTTKESSTSTDLLTLPHSQSHLVLRSVQSHKLQPAPVSPTIQTKEQVFDEIEETQILVPQRKSLDDTKTYPKISKTEPAPKSPPPRPYIIRDWTYDDSLADCGDEGVSHVTEAIIDEMSLSHFNSTSRVQDFDAFVEMIPLSARSSMSMRKSTTTASIANKSFRHEDSTAITAVSMSTTLPSDMGTLLTLPDIDRSSCSSEKSSLCNGFSSYNISRSSNKLARHVPMSITEMSALNFKHTQSVSSFAGIEPPPVPQEASTPKIQPRMPPQFLHINPINTVHHEQNDTFIRFNKTNNKRRAPLAHMNSLEQFEYSSSTTASPINSLRKNTYSVKRSRPDLTRINGTPRPVKKSSPPPDRLSIPDSPFLDVRQEALVPPSSPETPSPLPRQNNLLIKRQTIGGSMVPESFLEMVQRKDYERQVALVKRGRTVARIHSKAENGLRSQANKRFRSLKRAISSSLHSHSLTDKDVALQALARRIKKEKQAGHALLVVLMCFVLMWAPFFTLNIAYGICDDCVNKAFFMFFSWTGWASCGVNPIIYTLCSRQFRQGLFRSLADVFRRARGVDYRQSFKSHSTTGRSFRLP